MTDLRKAAEMMLFRLLGDENHDIQLRAAIALLQALAQSEKETLILDRGCWERGCIAHDERDGDGVTIEAKLKEKNTRNNKGKLFSYSVTDLNLDVRAMNCLEAEGIHTIGDLCNQHTYDLRKIPNLGKITLNNIVNALAEHGLKLKS
jgi:DNA-directed RNA polymerase alpha subunit